MKSKNQCPTCRSIFISVEKTQDQPKEEAIPQRFIPLRVLPSLSNAIREDLMKQAIFDFKTHYEQSKRGKRKMTHTREEKYHELVENISAAYPAYRRGKDRLFEEITKEGAKIRGVNILVNPVADGIMVILKADFDLEAPWKYSEPAAIPGDRYFEPAAKRRRTHGKIP